MLGPEEWVLIPTALRYQADYHQVTKPSGIHNLLSHHAGKVGLENQEWASPCLSLQGTHVTSAHVSLPKLATWPQETAREQGNMGEKS